MHPPAYGDVAGCPGAHAPGGSRGGSATLLPRQPLSRPSLAFPGIAGAHAFLVQISPEAEQRLSSGPRSLELQFTEPVVAATQDRVTVRTAAGQRVAGGALARSADGTILTAGLPALGQGVYLVDWQVVSTQDGHYVRRIRLCCRHRRDAACGLLRGCRRRLARGSRQLAGPGGLGVWGRWIARRAVRLGTIARRGGVATAPSPDRFRPGRGPGHLRALPPLRPCPDPGPPGLATWVRCGRPQSVPRPGRSPSGASYSPSAPPPLTTASAATLLGPPPPVGPSLTIAD